MTGASTGAGRWLQRTCGPLRDRRFRLLWTGQSISHVGNAVATIALTLGILAHSNSASALGIVLGAAGVAEVATTLMGGVLADRLPRRRQMMAADAVRCLAQVVVALQLFAQHSNVVVMAVAAAFAGGALGIYLPAASGIVPATVEKDQLPQANALVALARRTAFLFGPAIGTTVAVTVGAGWALLFDALTFLVNLTLLSRLQLPHIPREPTTFRADLAEGWRQVRTTPWLWSSLLVFCVWNLGRCFYFVVGPLVVIDKLSGEVGWAAVVQGGTVGALFGAFLGLHLRPRRPLVVLHLCNALGALPLFLIAAGAPVIAIAVAAGLMSISLGLGSIWATVLQSHIPSDQISRVFSYDWLVSVSLIPLGMALAGPIAEAVGPSAALGGAGVAMVIAALAVLPIRGIRALGLQPAAVVVPEPATPVAAEG